MCDHIATLLWTRWLDPYAVCRLVHSGNVINFYREHEATTGRSTDFNNLSHPFTPEEVASTLTALKGDTAANAFCRAAEVI